MEGELFADRFFLFVYGSRDARPCVSTFYNTVMLLEILRGEPAGVLYSIT